MVWHRCISAFKFKTILASALFLLFLFYCILDLSMSEHPVKKRRTLKRIFEERRERMENYCDADKSTPKTPLRELLPPKRPNFHILENLRRPILLCAPKKVGSMTFFWAFLTHLDEDDGASWVLGPNKSKSEEILMRPSTLRAMVTRHPFERLASTYKYAVGDFDPNIGYPPIDGIGWLSSKIKEQLRRPNESLSSVLEFKEFVAFLLDKENAFEQVKRDFNASFFFMDDHWSSYYNYCSTCELRPELILELSELAIELPVLVQRSGLGRAYPDFLPLEHENARHRPGEKTTADLFKDVELPDLEELIKLYKEDFDIHGYDPYKYLMS